MGMLSDMRKTYRKHAPLWVRSSVYAARRAPTRLRDAFLYPVRFRYAYTRNYFFKRDCPEVNSYKLGIIRPGDMGAAIGYSIGYLDLESVCDVLGANPDDPRALPTHMNGQEQVQALMAGMTRKPGLVLDAGAGRGEISALLNHAGIRCIAIEPASVGPDMIRETSLKYCGAKYPERRILNTGLYDGLLRMQGDDDTPDTVIMCESLEHIPEREFDRSFEVMRYMLRGGGRLVITNWPDFHPIERTPLHWDHIRTVDDSVYDRMAGRAARTIYRRGSHLVLEF